MYFKLFKMSLFFWLRAFIFYPKFMRNIERILINIISKNRSSNIETYFQIIDKIILKVKNNGHKNLDSITFMEIGTGQNLILPIMLKMAGAKLVYTVDIADITVLNLIKSSLRKILKSDDFKKLLNRHDIKVKPFEGVDPESYSNVHDLLKDLGIKFIHDCDLSKPSSIDDFNYNSIDFVYSMNVFEHIPKPTYSKILLNLKSHLRNNTIHIHQVDLSDHFSHAITGMNSLNHYRFGKVLWAIISNNRYAYHNRNIKSDYDEAFSKIFDKYSSSISVLQTQGEIQQTNNFVSKVFHSTERYALKIYLEVN